MSKHGTNHAQQRSKSITRSGPGETGQFNDTNAQWNRNVLTFLKHHANANNIKVNTHNTQAPKQQLGELLKLFDDTTSSQRPDDRIEDIKLKHMFMIEVARADDSLDSLWRVHAKNMCQYNPRLHAFRMALPQCAGKQQNYIIGVEGSTNQQQWRQQLTELETNSYQLDKTIQKCIAASTDD